ncbi:helix-turn-helix domain-containing protein [Enterococcus faecalis]|uniref:helix-turn-helix domain-containing protein n=1 Tax=Enterococcus faecalis TaxID=1351 RepID=UPI0040425BB7
MIYEKIRKLAIAKGVSIYRVERDAGLSNGAISKWGKSADQTPSSESLKKVADYFSVSMEYLLEDEKQEV